jgi:hypothetical protein
MSLHLIRTEVGAPQGAILFAQNYVSDLYCEKHTVLTLSSKILISYIRFLTSSECLHFSILHFQNTDSLNDLMFNTKS